MKKRTRRTCTLLALALTFSGCSDVEKPAEKNFLTALNAYYGERHECLFNNTLSFPYETAIKDESPAGSKGLDALTASLLMKRQQGKLVGINRYTLTPAGEQAGGRFCYGRREATAIVSFTPPVMENGRQSTTVTYTYAIKDLPVWANTDTMRAAFPELAKATAPAPALSPEDTMQLVLTPNGWAVGIDTVPLAASGPKN
jgi:hypothetical protein